MRTMDYDIANGYHSYSIAAFTEIKAPSRNIFSILCFFKIGNQSSIDTNSTKYSLFPIWKINFQIGKSNFQNCFSLFQNDKAFFQNCFLNYTNGKTFYQNCFSFFQTVKSNYQNCLINYLFGKMDFNFPFVPNSIFYSKLSSLHIANLKGYNKYADWFRKQW